MKKLNFICLALILLACEQNELPITPHPMGEIKSTQINMQSDYRNQLFYNLENNLVITENLKTEWDLAFESSEEGWHIILNSSRFSKASELTNTNFNEIISISSLSWIWEQPEGINSGNAIGDYRGKQSLYIIDRGFNLDGNPAGFKKLMIDSVTEEFYYIKYSNLDNTNNHILQIKKDNTTNFQHLSFESNNIVNIEPNKNDWDLMFTQYTHLYNDPLLPPSYLVTGVLTNYLNNVSIAKDTTNKFEDINYSMLQLYSFSNNQNEIGYDWKTYTGNGYSINTEMVYIVKDVSNRFFKLRFIDFYNSDGEKGYPKFEFQEL